MNVKGYRTDLAYIHDAGHSAFALGAAPGLLRLLERQGIASGLVVDLGCGSGRWARELNRAGYEVLGVDQSPAMIRLARRIAPRSKFRVASLLDAALPACDAITSMGECLNYCFDEANCRSALLELFARAWEALRPGGVFICDFATPARRPKSGVSNYSAVGPDWAVISAAETLERPGLLCRRITSFRRAGRLYRRSEEVHYLRLYSARDIVADLDRCGFNARVLRRYGAMRLPKGIAGVLAVKP
ncbi:MAG TPA: class I SAM-dependent methyltransferase [Bryobacteraceae bacterium]